MRQGWCIGLRLPVQLRANNQDKVWVNSIESDLSSLRVYVTSLRKKIEKISNEKYIQTHVGVGYKMIKIDNSDIEEKNNESSKY